MKKILYSILFIIVFSIDAFSQNSFLLKQADEGNIDAQLYLAKKYFDGDSGYENNYQKSFKYYKMAAVQGNPDAQFWTYMMLEEGIGTDKNEDEALSWLLKSAENSNPMAIIRLGVYYYDTQDYKNAFDTLSDYENRFGFHPWVAEILGRMYYWGNTVEQDSSKALQYFQKILSLQDYSEFNPGEIDSMIGLLYQHGISVEKNLESAEKLFKIAINKNPDDIKNWELLGGLYLEYSNEKECKKIWDYLLTTNPDVVNSQSPFAVAMGGSIDYLIPKLNHTQPNTYAIVIANENYKRVPNVPYAINDGKIFQKYLVSTLGLPEGNVEYLEDASLNDIKYSINNISQRCNAFKDQISVIIYYAGHGVPDDKTAEAFLLPVDGFGTDPSSGLNLDDFYSSLSVMPAKYIVVLLDACFSGAKRDGGMLLATRGITIKPKMNVPDGKLIVISATSNDETAFPIENQRHGLFTYTLLRKIQETGGDITWGQLTDHVTETVKSRSIELNGKLQSPTVSVSSSMKDTWKNLPLK